MDFWRQLDILKPSELNISISIIGAGGIGGPTALVLAKMGCRQVTVFDNDTIESHNLPNQFYRLADVGKFKVEALKEIIGLFTGVKIDARKERFSLDGGLTDVIISGVDTMASRKEIWEAIKWKTAVRLYIDGRMGGEVARIFSARPHDPDDVNFYEKTLYSDDDSEDLACTAQAIIYNVFAMASFIANQVKRVVKNEDLDKEIVLDFKTITLIKR